MLPAITSRPPTQSMMPTAPSTSTITTVISQARWAMRLRAVSKARSTVPAKRWRSWRLVVVGLHGLDLTEGLTDVAADVGHPVLAFPRQAAHAAAEQQDRGDHQRQRQHHDAGQLGVGDEHQQHPADQHQGIAQGHRQRGTDHRLQQRSVGGQARLDLGATVGFVETGMQLDQVVEHALADIGDEALADPGHQVEAHEGAHGQAEHQHEEQQDVAIEQFGRGGEEPLVHQQADALAQGQGDRRGEQQRPPGPRACASR
ncbi:Uncharacterised protein [Pseudomonas aeruginosa]|nr:Uncharacterised protein [Pseudomonas aeruginosa]